MGTETEKKEVNYGEYGYIGTEIIPIQVQDYFKLKELVDEYLLDETKPYFEEKYMYVDVNTGAKVEKLTEKNKTTSKKIVNIDATMNSTPKIFRTPRGMKLLEMKFMMNEIHKKMVDTGVASHIPTLQAQQDAPLGETAEGTEI